MHGTNNVTSKIFHKSLRSSNISIGIILGSWLWFNTTSNRICTNTGQIIKKRTIGVSGGNGSGCYNQQNGEEYNEFHRDLLFCFALLQLIVSKEVYNLVVVPQIEMPFILIRKSFNKQVVLPFLPARAHISCAEWDLFTQLFQWIPHLLLNRNRLFS